MNPARLDYIAEKPCREPFVASVTEGAMKCAGGTTGPARTLAHSASDPVVGGVLELRARSRLRPRERYQLPQSSAQAVGWLAEFAKHSNHHSRRRPRGNQMTDVTEFG